MHYFFFIFKHRFRKSAFNNFLKIKRVKNYRIIDLSGPFKYFLFTKILVFFINLFKAKYKNVTFISCDGLPFVKTKGVNIWFGGTSLRVPLKFKKFKNNLPMIRNFIVKEKNFISLYPRNLKNITFKNSFKIIYIGALKLNNSPLASQIWKKYKKKIFLNLSLIDNKKFWTKLKLQNHNQIHNIYFSLKNLIRLDIIKQINKNFKNDLIIVGDDWKKHIKNSVASNHDIKFIRSLYTGNLCLDFGSKWGDNSLYPRSVEIIEAGGFLIQSLQADSTSTFKNLRKFNTFNSINDLIKIIKIYKKNPDLLNSNFKKIYSYFSNEKLNYKTLTIIKNLSKK